MNCPKCGSDVRRSRRRFLERLLLKPFSICAFRCLLCTYRFYHVMKVPKVTEAATQCRTAA